MLDLKYILDENGEPVLEPDLFKWAAWFEKDRQKWQTVTMVGAVRISTVFLGLDHNFGWLGNYDPLTYHPILWETMIFGGIFNQYQRRYATLAEASEGHAEAVRAVEEWKNAPTDALEGTATAPEALPTARSIMQTVLEDFKAFKKGKP